MQLHQHSISETISKRYFQEIDNINQYAGIEDFFTIESKLLFEIYHLRSFLRFSIMRTSFWDNYAIIAQ